MGSPAIDYSALAAQSRAPGGPVDYSALAAQSRAPSKSYAETAKDSTGSMVGDAFAGAGAGAIHSILGAYHLLRMVPGVGDKLPPPSDFIESLGTAPETIAGHVGKFGEQAAEFMIPASKVGKVTEGAHLITRAAAQAATAGTVRAAQTGGDPGQIADAAAMGAAGPVLSAAGGAAVKAIKNNPAVVKAVSETAPDLVGMISPRAGNALRVAGKVMKATLPERVAAVAESATQESQLLDGIAQSQAGKPFNSLSLQQQEAVRNLARLSQARTAPQAAAPTAASPGPVNAAAPEVAPQPAATPQAAAPVVPPNTFVPGGPLRPPIAQTTAPAAVTPIRQIPTNATPRELGQFPAKQVVDWLSARNGNAAIEPTPVAAPAPVARPVLVPKPSIAEQLRAEMLKNGTVTAEQTGDPLRDMMRDVPAGMEKEIAKANYAGNQEPKAAGAVYEAAGRADKANKLADALHKGGIPYADAVRMDPDHWEMLSKALGVNAPSKSSISETLFRLKRLEAAK